MEAITNQIRVLYGFDFQVFSEENYSYYTLRLNPLQVDKFIAEMH